jgi:hypothetical protein
MAALSSVSEANAAEKKHSINAQVISANNRFVMHILMVNTSLSANCNE